MKLRGNIAVVMMICNEEYWLDYVIRPLTDAGLLVCIGDCGSTDGTRKILNLWEKECSNVYVREYGQITPLQNGKVRQELAEWANTFWVLQVDGDEILTPEGVQTILDIEMGDHLGAFITQQVLKWDEEDKCIRLANKTSHRRIHRGNAEWVREYPYENTTDGNERRNRFFYPPGMTGYHMKFLRRSSQDKSTYKRISNNERYWPYLNSLPLGEVVDLFGIIGPPRFPNPYYQEK